MSRKAPLWHGFETKRQGMARNGKEWHCFEARRIAKE
nr:MAG TPA: hypothetical protein [Caudoviricetes sp.]